MKHAIGFNLGQRGDLILNTVVARSFKEQCPDWHLTLGVGPEYADMEPFFKDHPHIDAFHVYGSYDGWPNETDRQYLLAANYDTVFNGMPRHTNDQWWRWIHQAEETCWMHGLRAPSNGIHCQLTPWFEVENRRDWVAFAPFAGWYNLTNDKKLSRDKAQDIVDLIISRGFKVLQIGGPGEPRLNRATFCETSYFESIRAILGCELFIHTDTGAGWAVSAYRFRQLGLYSHAYYGADRVAAIQPINPNAKYLSVSRADEIELDTIAQAMKDMGL